MLKQVLRTHCWSLREKGVLLPKTGCFPTHQASFRSLQSSICWWWKLCLFEVLVPPENSSFIWRRHHYRWRTAQFDLCAALMAIEQWEFCGVPHLLWHGATVHNGHLREPLTLTPITEHLTLELSLPVFTTKVCRDWDLNTQPSACVADALTHCATAAISTGYVAARIQTPNLPLAGRTLYPLPHRRVLAMKAMRN